MRTAYAWALAMSITAVTQETLYRRLAGPWGRHVWLWVPLHVLTGFLAYNLVRTADSLLGAFVIGNFVSLSLRVVSTLTILHDTVRPSTWAALGLLVLAQVVRLVWR